MMQAKPMTEVEYTDKLGFDIEYKDMEIADEVFAKGRNSRTPKR